MTRYVVAVHYICEDIELKEVQAESDLGAAKQAVETGDWDEQPENFSDLQRWFWDQCEGYVSVMEIK